MSKLKIIIVLIIILIIVGVVLTGNDTVEVKGIEFNVPEGYKITDVRKISDIESIAYFEYDSGDRTCLDGHIQVAEGSIKNAEKQFTHVPHERKTIDGKNGLYVENLKGTQFIYKDDKKVIDIYVHCFGNEAVDMIKEIIK